MSNNGLLLVKHSLTKTKTEEVIDTKSEFRMLFKSSFEMNKNQDKISFKTLSDQGKTRNYDRAIALVKLKPKAHKLRILKSQLASLTDAFWLLINSASINSYHVSKGDLIKLLNNIYEVRKIHGFTKSPLLSDEKIKASLLQKGGMRNITKLKVTYYKPTKLCEVFCRICLETSETEDDPFFNPCACSGSMGYLHFNCFKSWIFSKLLIESQGFYSTITWNSITCENCQSKIPESIRFLNHKFDLFENFKREGKYIILIVGKSRLKSENKALIIPLNDRDKFTISSTNIPIESQPNSSFIFHVINNEIHLENPSKSFACQVFCQKSITLHIGESCTLINGSHLFQFTHPKPNCLQRFFCCIKKKI